MSGPHFDKVFDGSIPTLYETHLVPLIFEPYAADLANRLASRGGLPASTAAEDRQAGGTSTP